MIGWILGSRAAQDAFASEMRKREFLVIGAAAAASPLWLAGCRTTSQTPSPTTDPAELRRAIDTESDAALARLYKEVSGSRELIQSAQGVLVLPNVVSGGLIFGGAGGNGVLRVADKSASYWRMSEAQIGLLGGRREHQPARRHRPADGEAEAVATHQQETEDAAHHQ